MTRTPGKEVCHMVTIPRRKGESVVIGDDVILTVLEIRGDKVRFLIECPKEAMVHRGEVYDAIQGISRLPTYGAGLSP
jgi:carbon storage regulator